MMQRSAWLACLLALAACTAPADQGPGRNLLGTWHYTGLQNAPGASLAGTLSVTAQSGSAFSGRLEVQETDATGSQRARAGAATGHAPAALPVDFDVLFSTSPRRHVARVIADTMEGNWVETSSAGITTGTFRAVRTSAQ